jgi:hypothetical protein
LTATLTATAATTGDRLRSTTARNARPTIHANWDMSGLKSRRSGISARAPRLLPTLLPSRWTAPDARGQLRNIGPAYDRRRTVLDDLPTPTDLKVAGSSARDMREMSGAPVIKAVTSAEVRRSAQEPARAAYPVVRKQRHADRIPPS